MHRHGGVREEIEATSFGILGHFRGGGALKEEEEEEERREMSGASDIYPRERGRALRTRLLDYDPSPVRALA